MIRYCLPIIAENDSAVFEAIGSATGDYAFFEIWLDYLERMDIHTCEQLASMAGEERLIFLFRRQNLEAIRMTIGQRIEIMRWLNKRNAFLDLDISSQQEEIEFLKKNSLRVNTIVSYHNYSLTPPEDKLKSILEEMCALKASVLKIATMCRYPKDGLLLLKLGLELEERGQRHIILGMGEHGKITRIFGTLWGNEMIFAPRASGTGSAPGQLTRSQLEKIFRELE